MVAGSLLAAVVLLVGIWLSWRRCPESIPVSAELLSAATGGEVIPEHQWHAYRSTDLGFAVRFPAVPKRVSHPTGRIYVVADTSDAAYSVSVFSDDGTSLADRVRGVASERCNTLVRSEELKVGEGAVEYVMEDPRGGEIGKPVLFLRRLIRKEGKVYVIGVTVPVGKSAAYQQFVDAFELL